MCFEYHKFRKPLGLEECESWAVIGGAASRAIGGEAPRAIGGEVPRGGMGRPLCSGSRMQSRYGTEFLFSRWLWVARKGLFLMEIGRGVSRKKIY